MKLPYSGDLCLDCRTILIDDDFDKGMTHERFLVIKRFLWENYEGPWTDDWYRSYKFLNVGDQVGCEHMRTEDLPHTRGLCLGCHVILIDNKLTSDMTHSKYNEIVRALLKRSEIWNYEFLNMDDGSRREIACLHVRKESIEDTVFCVSCALVDDEVIYQREHDETHAVRTPVGRLVTEEEAEEVECRRVFAHFQGRCGYPVIKPETLVALRGRLPGDRATKPDVKVALKAMGLQRLLKHVHHVHHLVTGVPKNDIEKHEDRLVGEMDWISGQFMVKENKINKQFLMMLLLESHGEKFDRSEFFFPKSMEKYEVGLREFISEM